MSIVQLNAQIISKLKYCTVYTLLLLYLKKCKLAMFEFETKNIDINLIIKTVAVRVFE